MLTAAILLWFALLAWQARALETNLRLWTQAQSQASTASLKAAAYVDTGESKGSLSSVDGSGQRRPLFRDVWSRFQHLRAVHAAQSLWWVPAAPVIQVAVFATNAMAIRSLVDRGSAGLDREGGTLVSGRQGCPLMWLQLFHPEMPGSFTLCCCGFQASSGSQI